MGNYRDSKKAKVLAKQKRKKQIRIVLLSAVAVVAMATFVFMFARAEQRKNAPTNITNAPVFGGARSGARARTESGRHTSVTPINGAITFNTADFSGGKAAYYTTKAAGKSIDFFVLQSSDGVIRAAFDACDVCYAAKKGYRQEGDIMVCNNCGQQFPSVRINIEKGGCNPSPLNRRLEGESVIITKADIQKGLMYF